jgi:alginate biosynthesis protein AlgX
LLQRTTALHRGSNEILFNGGGKVQPLVGARHWLDFQFDDPGVQQLHAVIWYLNGQKESMKLRFKEYVNNEGRFVAELRNNRPDYAGATFMGATIELEQEPAKPLTVEAQVCQAIDPPALPRQVKTAASAQSSPEDSPKKTSPKRSSRRSGNVQN